MAHRIVSLAAGCVLDIDPPTAVSVAAAAGFGGVGLWFDPELWTAQVGADVVARLDDTGLMAVDIEPVILGRGTDPGERMIEAAALVGARHLLVASGPAERSEVVERVGRLADRAARHAPGLTIVVEFLPIFTIATIGHAVGVVRELDLANVGVLVDALHLQRSGGTPADVAEVAALVPYLQICDAPLSAPVDRAGLRDEALHGRLLPGQGALPLGELLDAVPGVALSVELRSQRLLLDHPDPVRRAMAIRAAVSDLDRR